MFNLSFQKIRLVFLFIFLAELVSFAGYFAPSVNKLIFFVIAVITLFLSLYKLEYGLLVLLAELFIGSKGYLFFYEQASVVISIRIALWLIIMSVWLSRFIIEGVRNKKFNIIFLESLSCKYFLAFFAFLGWGIINGILKQNNFSNIFFDFNNWLYFALIFPVFHVINTKEKFYNIINVFSASISWLALKTFFLLFAFSHNLISIVYELYRWIRVTGVGEITQMTNGFVRIFFQSHIFVLAGLFILISFLIKFLFENKKKLNFKFILTDKHFLILVFGLVFLISTIILSFSRSYWVGLGGGLAVYALILILKLVKKEINFQQIGFFLLCFLVSTILSVGLIAAVVKFPYPKPSIYFSTDLLSDRALNLSEAGASSRWSLLPKLWLSIKEAPLRGKGFGATVSYITSDPRILESSPKGEYTTYAFEWGWLDIWLKLGIIGLIIYLFLILKIIIYLLKHSFVFNDYLSLSMGVGLITIIIVSIFSPYMNHPLGIGYLILGAVLGHLHKK